MNKKSGIYIITNTVNKKVYIGSAVNFDKRVSQHKSNLLKNKHSNIHLQNFVNKYGFDTLSFNILELVKNKKNLIKREQKYIDSYKFKDLFNICKVAGSSLGTKASDATRKKMSKNGKGKNFGIIRTVATRKKIRESLRGRKASDATRKKMSESKKGIPLSAATVKKISEGTVKKTVLIFKDNILIDTVISTVATAKKYNLNQGCISLVCSGKRNYTGGYQMRYE